MPTKPATTTTAIPMAEATSDAERRALHLALLMGASISEVGLGDGSQVFIIKRLGRNLAYVGAQFQGRGLATVEVGSLKGGQR